MNRQKRIDSENQHERFDQLLLPFRLFITNEAVGGFLLMGAAFIALFLANSPWKEVYYNFWQMQFSISFADFTLKKPLLIWINDGLMAMFFFVVGLELKREVIVGELSSLRRAMLPMASALGGMLLPAIFFALFNFGSAGMRGWGIPMATDIAFALGVVVLLGKRVPSSIKIFLAALAIVDDIGAVLIIAVFYTSKISIISLMIGAAFLFALILANWLNIRNVFLYALLGIGGLWLAFLLSGVHPTIAGVLAALCIPARTRFNSEKFVETNRQITDEFAKAGEIGESVLTNKDRQAIMLQHKILYEGVTSPLQRLEKTLHPWVIFLVMPVFALANAGVTLESDVFGFLSTPVGIGIILGLVVGKQLGIFAGAWLAVKGRIAVLPDGINWRMIYGVSWLGGIGFTMSLFIASLAYKDEKLLIDAKKAIFCASIISAVGGYYILSRVFKKSTV